MPAAFKAVLMPIASARCSFDAIGKLAEFSSFWNKRSVVFCVYFNSYSTALLLFSVFARVTTYKNIISSNYIYNAEAEAKGVNFSHILQASLKEHLGMAQ